MSDHSEQKTPAPQFQYRNLRRRMLILLIGSVAVVMLVSQIFIQMVQYSKLQNEHKIRVQHIAERLAYTTAQPLWTFDHNHLEQLLLQEFKEAEVQAIFLTSAEGKLLIGKTRSAGSVLNAPKAPDTEGSAASQLTASSGIFHQNLLIGSVKVVLDKASVQNIIWNVIIMNLWQMLLVLGFIASLTYIGISRIILGPLQALHSFAQELASGKLTSRTIVQVNDEIGSLGSTLNMMAEKLENALKLAKEKGEDLEDLNRRLNDIINFVPDPMLVIDNDGKVIAWNNAIERLTNIRKADILGKGNCEYSIPFYGERRPLLIDLLKSDEDEVTKYYSNIQKYDNRLQGEAQSALVHAGRETFMWVHASHLYDGNGSIFGAVEIIRDITDEKQARLELMESEKRFRTLIEEAPIGISMVRDGRYVYSNRAHTRTFGFDDPAEFTCMNMIDRFASDCKIELLEKVTSKAEAEGSSVQLETIGVRKDGTHFPYLVSSTQLSLPDGIVSLAFGTDITERQQTRELMIQSEKMTMIAGMAAGMAHEVNNPLGIITQDIQNLERRFSPALPANCTTADELGVNLDMVAQYMEQRDITNFIASMRGAVKRASNIITNMLQFSRQSDATHQLINLNEIIEQSIRLASSDFDIRKKYDFNNIAITREYDEQLPLVPICVTEIEQVIINLLKNAAQAMFEAGTDNPTIAIHTFRRNGHAKIVIKDNGPGMSESIRQRIFDPFFTTKEVGSGTGLGLSVSYTIITKNHAGELFVESTPGMGASFTIRLPISVP